MRGLILVALPICHDFAALSSGAPILDGAAASDDAASHPDLSTTTPPPADLSFARPPDFSTPPPPDLSTTAPDFAMCGGAGTSCTINSQCCTNQGLACAVLFDNQCVTCLTSGQACGSGTCCPGLGCIQDPVTLVHACGACRAFGQPCMNARACCDGLVCQGGMCK